MLKAGGCIFIFLGSIGLACSMQKERHEHLKLLYEIRSLLLKLSQNMHYRMLPMELLLREAHLTEEKRLKKICMEIGENLEKKESRRAITAWKECFLASRKELHLSMEETELLAEAGEAFFGKNITENERHLALYLERLEERIKEERRKQGERDKVIGTVTVMGGLFVILLLI